MIRLTHGLTETVMMLVMMPVPLAAATIAGAGEVEVGPTVERAQASYRRGQLDDAIRLASRVIQQDPNHQESLLLRAMALDRKRLYAEAIKDYDRLLQLNPTSSQLYLRRGSARFGLGDVKGSIEDFDEQIRLDPESEAAHWQRGLSYYYVGRYQDGARQFELGKDRYASDVENVVWRFACQAKTDGVDAALRDMLQLKGIDTRVPMMQVHELFLGNGTVEAVLRAAEHAENSQDRNRQLFYAHLYIGLYHAAHGNKPEERSHMFEADKRQISHYMWDVAHVHAELLRKREQPTRITNEDDDGSR